MSNPNSSLEIETRLRDRSRAEEGERKGLNADLRESSQTQNTEGVAQEMAQEYVGSIIEKQ